MGWLLPSYTILCCAKCRRRCNSLLHRNHMSFGPELHRCHNCSLQQFKMMCWVTRTELYAIHHRIHCCRIISSLHSTHLLLLVSPEVRRLDSMRGVWDQLWRSNNSMLIAIGFQCSFDFHQRRNSAKQIFIIVDRYCMCISYLLVQYSSSYYSTCIIVVLEYDIANWLIPGTWNTHVSSP